MEENIAIQSERLYVRPWKEDDWKEFYLVMSKPQVHKYTSEKLWTVEKTKSVMDWFKQHKMGWEWKPGYFNCPLILRSNDQIIGRVGLNPFLEEKRIPEIEWTIGLEYWGKGYATEIGRAMLRFGFNEARFDEIIGFALPQHTASRKVMQKIGMEYVGENKHRGKTWSFYQIKSEDFESKEESQ